MLALLMRLQLARPGNDFLSADLYNQVFTLHGSVMMFLFAIPIFEAVSIMFLPQMIGARELPFPRLSAFGFWAFAIGGTFLCGSIFFNAAPRGGWFMYPPLTSRYQPDIGADIWLLGFSFIEVAAIAAAVELIVGVLKCRPPGMRLNLVPLYAWYVLVAAFMVLFAFPPLIAGTMLLELERAFGWPFFNPAGGGDPLLWQHLFWIFGHPEVYIIFLPSVALVAMIVPTAAQRPIVGYSWVVLAAIGTGFLSFGLWVHHMFTTGLPGITLALFSAASTAVAIPTGVQFFCFLATLLAGRVARSVPMLYIIGGLSTFVIGGLTGVMVAMAPFNFQAHDTYFIVAHLHTVLIGGAVFPLLAGLYYYFPLVNGKQLSERLGRVSFWLVFVGFNVTFMPMHVSGLLGMPRRVFTYPAGSGVRRAQPDLDRRRVRARGRLRRGRLGRRPAERQGAPRAAQSLERRHAGVAAGDARAAMGHAVGSRDRWPLSVVGSAESSARLRRGTVLPARRGGRPAGDARDVERRCQAGAVHAHSRSDVHHPRRGGLRGRHLHFSDLQDVHRDGRERGALAWRHRHMAVDREQGRFRRRSSRTSGWACGCRSMCRDAIRWAGGRCSSRCSRCSPPSCPWSSRYFFFWTLHANFPPQPVPWPRRVLAGRSPWRWLAAPGVSPSSRRRWNARDLAGRFYAGMLAAVALAVAGTAALIAGPSSTGLDPTAGVYPATVWLLVIWAVVHVAVGVMMQLYCLARRAAGRMTCALRHRYRQRRPVLAFHGSHRRAHGRGGCRFSAGGVDHVARSCAKEPSACGCRSSAPVLWAVHFTLCYITAALWCGRFAATTAPGGMRLVIGAYTAVAMAGIGVSFVHGLRRHRYQLPTRDPRRRHAGRPPALHGLYDHAARGTEPAGDRLRGARRLDR